MMRNKRGITPIVVAGILLLIMMVVYLILYIPIPAFTEMRQTINYFLVLILWIIFQFAIIYGAYKVVAYLFIGFRLYKTKVVGWALKVKKYIISH